MKRVRSQKYSKFHNVCLSFRTKKYSKSLKSSDRHSDQKLVLANLIGCKLKGSFSVLKRRFGPGCMSTITSFTIEQFALLGQPNKALNCPVFQLNFGSNKDPDPDPLNLPFTYEEKPTRRKWLTDKQFLVTRQWCVFRLRTCVPKVPVSRILLKWCDNSMEIWQPNNTTTAKMIKEHDLCTVTSLTTDS